MTKRWVSVAMVVVVGGVVGACGASMRGGTGDSIHCDGNDVIILEPRDEAGVETWNARCRGRTREYLCSRAADDSVSCDSASDDGQSEVLE